MSRAFKIRFLGTGTSAGVPMVACDCPVCKSHDPRDRRLRSSVALSIGGLDILVDTSPDFREQAIRTGMRRVDLLFITHAHVDHLFGLDDIRRINTVQGTEIPLYAAQETLDDIRRIFAYIFTDQIPGTYRPMLALHPAEEPLSFPAPHGGEVAVVPVPVVHGRTMTQGYVFEYAGRRFAYVPDCHEMPKASMAALRGLDLLALDALKRGGHPTHLSLGQALAISAELAPRRTLLTHICHDLGHAALEAELAARGLTSVAPAYDGLEIDLSAEGGAP